VELGPQHAGLGAEVAEERPGADPGLGRDLLDRGGLEALLGEQPQGDQLQGAAARSRRAAPARCGACWLAPGRGETPPSLLAPSPLLRRFVVARQSRRRRRPCARSWRRRLGHGPPPWSPGPAAAAPCPAARADVSI